MGKKKKSKHHGVLVVDKPKGPTSHDIVAKVRRVFQTRSVGHAGTLDPMATGVLVVAIGEGTKLVPYLTADDKEYIATLTLGQLTDSLDAMGELTETLPIPELSDTKVREVMKGFIGSTEQVAPKLSAIKQGGESLHKKVRRGEEVVAPTRTVFVHELELISRTHSTISLRVHSAKGFYVRSLARDLAEALGTVGHLTELRRVRSGGFHVDGAVSVTAFAAPDDCPALLVPMERAHGLTSLSLTSKGKEDAFHGRPLSLEDVVGEGVEEGQLCALCSDGRLTAIARREASGFAVVRGFRFD